jgi:4-amino-4-deoxy-L-arabinose transferase-like glycosyltransferase
MNDPRWRPTLVTLTPTRTQRWRLAAQSVPAVVWLCIALTLAALLRLTLLATLDVQQSSDAQWYLDRAWELASTGQYAENGVPTAFWPVGYPAFLAALMALFGHQALVGQVANAVLGVLAVLLVYRFGVQQFGSHRVGAVAALLLAVYPNHLGYAAGLYTEPLYTVLLLALVVVARSRWPAAGKGLWRWGPCRWSTGRWLLAGLLAGAATLVKSQTLMLAPLLLALLALRGWDRPAWRRMVPLWLLAMAGMAAVVTPWTWRNHVVMGAAVPVSTNGGMSLWIANNPNMHVGQRMDYDDRNGVYEAVGFSVADQVAADQRARALARRWIADNPDRFLALMPWKAWRLWAYDGESEWIFQRGYAGYQETWLAFRAARGLNQVYYLLLLAAGLWGLWRVFKAPGGQAPRALVLPLLLVFSTALAAVFSGQARYHYALMPFVFAYAAWWLMGLPLRRR